MGTIRQPKKITSIEKKNKIISAGLECFCQNGYYNTTTPQIAKKAGVSTGIIYSYFIDKKDIFIQSLDLYFTNLYNPMLEKLDKAKFEDLNETISSIIKLTIASHKTNQVAHEEMIAMNHLDEDVHNKFMQQEQKVILNIVETLKNKNINIENANEKVHIAYNLIENLCHEYVFHKHDFINYDKMIEITTHLILELLSNKR